jgi:hypothetical protein
MEEKPPRLAPIDPDAPYAIRMGLIRKYWYLTLKFSHPFISESGRWEATWNGGEAAEDTEDALLRKVFELMEDCGSDGHLWKTIGEVRDATAADNVILTQRCVCVFCDPKERTITIYHPHRTVLESSQLPH